MRKVVIDTNIYIDWLNRGLHADLMTGPGWVRYLSAVVAMELCVGARTAPARKAIRKLIRAYDGARRIISPTAVLYQQAGGVLARLDSTGHSIGRAATTHDVLIALTARAIGATVVTRNAKDFEAIGKVVEIRWEAAGTAK